MSSSPHRRPLGLVSATCLVIASMIGAGVFTTSGYALADLGSPAWVMLAWCVGSVVALCGAASYATLATELSDSGGEYLYLSRLVHPLVGFLAGWISLTAGFTGAIAFAASTFEQYAAPLVMRDTPPPGLIALVIIGACTLMHVVGVRTGAGAQNVVVFAKLALLLLIVCVGGYVIAARSWPAVDAVAPAPRLFAFANTLTWIALSFSGFNAAIYVAGEIRDAKRTVPRAMYVGTLLVIVLYLALNALFVLAGPIGQLAGQSDIAAVATELLGGTGLSTTCRVAICLALATSVSANLLAGPRVYDRMAADGLFPLPWRVAGHVPRSAIVLQGLLAGVVVYFTSLRQQLDYLGVLLSLSAATTAATILFRRQAGVLTRAAAAIFVVASLVFAGITAARNEQAVGIAVAITLAVGVGLYFVLRRTSRSQA